MLWRICRTNARTASWRVRPIGSKCWQELEAGSWKPEANMNHVRFGLFEFDGETGMLTREGVPVRLQPQPARVLGLLVRAQGEVVTREMLKQEVWGDGTFVDFERGLNFCIAQI